MGIRWKGPGGGVAAAPHREACRLQVVVRQHEVFQAGEASEGRGQLQAHGRGGGRGGDKAG
jgi:hypothetical protein